MDTTTTMEYKSEFPPRVVSEIVKKTQKKKKKKERKKKDTILPPKLPKWIFRWKVSIRTNNPR